MTVTSFLESLQTAARDADLAIGRRPYVKGSSSRSNLDGTAALGVHLFNA
jgi:hypothetical protein